MLIPRKIPVLQIFDGKLIKTQNFKNPQYVGDPLNAVKIFNDKEVDELILLDITPDRRKTGPDFILIDKLLSECQMPVGYGGGVQNLSQAHKIFHAGAEKIVINTLAFEDPHGVKKITDIYGSQAVSFSIDYDISFLGKVRFFKNSGKIKLAITIEAMIALINAISCGEVILHNISRDGSFKGFDYTLLNLIKDKIEIPIVLLGGAKDPRDLEQAILRGAHSTAAGSMFIFQGPHKAVLIQY